MTSISSTTETNPGQFVSLEKLIEIAGASKLVRKVLIDGALGPAENPWTAPEGRLLDAIKERIERLEEPDRLNDQGRTLLDQAMTGKHSPLRQDIVVLLVKAGGNPLFGQQSTRALRDPDWKACTCVIAGLLAKAEASGQSGRRGPLGENLLHTLALSPEILDEVLDADAYAQSSSPVDNGLVLPQWWTETDTGLQQPLHVLWMMAWALEAAAQAGRDFINGLQDGEFAVPGQSVETDNWDEASNEARWRVVRRALAQGANPSAKTAQGQTLLELIQVGIDAGHPVPSSCEDLWAQIQASSLEARTPAAKSRATGNTPRL